MQPGLEPIRNKVSESGIVTLDLAPFIPAPDSLVFFDLKPFLFMEMIVREKEFRVGLQAQDWSEFAGKHVGIGCSTDSVIPVWAYMLAASYLQPVAASVQVATLEALPALVITAAMATLKPEDYAGQRVVLKGCGDTPVPALAYVAATARLRPVVKSLMYGEPCSTVPVFKARPAPVQP